MARHAVLTILAVTVLLVGLTGCRSLRRQAPAATPPVAQAPSAPPATYYPPSNYPTTTYSSPAPTTPYPSSAYPTYSAPSTGMSGSATRVVRTVPSNPPSSVGGSPDGPSPFPDVAAAPSGGPGAAVPAYAGAINSGAELDIAITQLQNEMQRLRQEITQAGPDANPPAGRGGADLAADGRAAAFAEKLRQRTRGEVVQNGNVVVVRMTDGFEPGSDKLKKDAALTTTLLATAEALAGAGAREVKVVGHTDSDPISRSKWPSNKALSEARAQTVAHELSRRGVPASSLAVTGRGASEPLVPNERSKADKAKNRRVEILVTF